MKYLVVGSGGPGFASPGEVLDVLENIILPSFDELIKLENEKKILGEDFQSVIAHLSSLLKLHPTPN